MKKERFGFFFVGLWWEQHTCVCSQLHHYVYRLQATCLPHSHQQGARRHGRLRGGELVTVVLGVHIDIYNYFCKIKTNLNTYLKEAAFCNIFIHSIPPTRFEQRVVKMLTPPPSPIPRFVVWTWYIRSLIHCLISLASHSSRAGMNSFVFSYSSISSTRPRP